MHLLVTFHGAVSCALEFVFGMIHELLPPHPTLAAKTVGSRTLSLCSSQLDTGL